MADIRLLEKQLKDITKRVAKIEALLAPSVCGLDGNGRDELYEKAKAFVIKSENASASFLQRKLLIGYARAARILDELFVEGVIGPALGAAPRKILVKKEA